MDKLWRMLNLEIKLVDLKVLNSKKVLSKKKSIRNSKLCFDLKKSRIQTFRTRKSKIQKTPFENPNL